MGDHATELNLDVFEVARAVHRVVRAMNDGECPNCHAIVSSEMMRGDLLHIRVHRPLLPIDDLFCLNCKFHITKEDQDAAIATFAPTMEKNLAVFEEWRESRRCEPR